jgi:hypothetical protein
MEKMIKKISFIESQKDINRVIDPPLPSKKLLPKWYKDSSSFISDEKTPVFYDGMVNLTFKKCIPIFDSMTAGYTFVSPCEIYVLDPKRYSGQRFSWGNFPLEVIHNDHKLDQLQKYPLSNNFTEIFKWNFWWTIKTPPGYSCLFVHPLHREDLPYKTFSGIVDTDSYNVPILFPFLLNSEFSGKIEKGSPIVQIIPFKRDRWLSEKIGFDEHSWINSVKNSALLSNMYKNNFWNRKEYR